MPNRPPLSRRSVLAAGGGVIVVTGTAAACGSVPGATTSGAEPTAPSSAADADLVEEVGRAIADAAGRARATAGVAGLRPLARPFVRLHAAHLDKLGWTGTTSTPDVGAADGARGALLTAERRLQAKLARAAGDARSGALAQVLASMAAAVAQQLAVAG
ncbi:MAG TPA: hypothetical protein VNS55_03675 [Nocardioides sp.]|nr:hypothetical protein [Nocardioides sp.]